MFNDSNVLNKNIKCSEIKEIPIETIFTHYRYFFFIKKKGKLGILLSMEDSLVMKLEFS